LLPKHLWLISSMPSQWHGRCYSPSQLPVSVVRGRTPAMPKDVLRLLHALFNPAACADTPWRPAADVYRTPDRGWRVKFDLAGVRPEDVQLEADGPRLTLRGSRRDCAREKGCSYYRMEIAYSRFERTLELPCDVGRARVSTDYRDGMLLVHIQ